MLAARPPRSPGARPPWSVTLLLPLIAAAFTPAEGFAPSPHAAAGNPTGDHDGNHCDHPAGHQNGDPGSDHAALMNPRHPLWSRRAPEVFRVRFHTSQGSFVVEAHRSWAPWGADRFQSLASSGFFDDSRFFRVVAGFIAQFGIPGEPAVAALWQDRTIPDDPAAGRQSNLRGTLAFAMTGPGTRATQVYVNLADNSRLDGQGFAPFGRVVAGMDTLDRLYAGYGEQAGGGMRGGRQGKIFAGGNTYLDREFPKLDRLLSTRLLEGQK